VGPVRLGEEIEVHTEFWKIPLGTDEGDNITIDLDESNWNDIDRSFGSGEGPVVGSCECFNEQVGYDVITPMTMKLVASAMSRRVVQQKFCNVSGGTEVLPSSSRLNLSPSLKMEVTDTFPPKRL
jgi:hypothetical protein